MRLNKPQTTLTRLRSYGFAVAALGALSTLPQLAAQDDEDEDVFTLSPFEVSGEDDEGYRANSTLAGSRISTSLNDVASSISVVTEAFIDDVAAVDINDVLVYTGNTEGTGNFTAAPSAGIGGYDDTVSTNPFNANRIRGMGSATITRDFFVSSASGVGFDAYNLDRIDVNRGPNSILFGLGQSSGIINYTPKKAILTGAYNEVSLRYGSDDDMRASFDVNRVLIEDKLAVRISGLWSDRGFAQEPSWFRDNRVSLTGTYKPFESTTLQFTYETVNQSQNNPNSITPIDNISGWVEDGSQSWNPLTDNWSERPATHASTAAGGTLGATRPDGSMEYLFTEGVDETYWATYYQPNRDGVWVWSSLGLSDDRYLDLGKLNLRPTVNNNDLDSYLLSWDQRVMEDLYVNLAYFKEELENDGFNWTRANQFAVHTDFNEVLPDGSPNPHFGEVYMPSRTLDSKYNSATDNQSLRSTVNYELDLEGDVNKWLGRHSFTVLGEKREIDGSFEQYNEIRAGNPSYLNPMNRLEGYQFTRLRYLGGTATEPSTQGPRPPLINVSGLPHTYWDDDAGAWASDSYDSTFILKSRDVNGRELESTAQVWQSYWLDGKIVGMAGWRQDKESAGNARSAGDNIDANGYVIVDDSFDLADTGSGDTETRGVVVHPLDWLSLHYNESENFTPAGDDVNIFGESISSPAGEGKDYGFSLHLLDRKLEARVNWFEMSQTNSRISNSGPDIAAQWELPWFDQEVIPLLAEEYGMTHGPSDFFSSVNWGNNRIEETADVVAEGMEIELTYNPTENLRIMANVSRQEAVRSNIGAALTRWVEEVLPVWQSQPWWDGPETVDAGWGTDGNLQTYFNTFNSTRILATYKSQEGQPNPQIREWRANVIANYTFSDGKLAGWNTGGALRWQDEAAIGHPAVTEVIGGTEQLVGLDLANPYTDGGELDLDVWAGYSRKIWNDSMDWNLQLNVRNLTRSDQYRPIVTNSDGTDAVFRIEFGPTWYLTSTFSW